MKFLMALFVSAPLMISVSHVQSQQAGDQSDISAEEYAIYAMVIGNIFDGDNGSPDSKVGILVIQDQTMSDDTAAALRKDEWNRVKRKFSPIISRETIDDYVAKNAKSYQLTKSLGLKLDHTLAPEEKIDEIFKSGWDGWREFYKQFPNSRGVILLSRVGLDSSGKQAFVYLAHSCGELCGAGYYLSLVKKNKKWIVQKKFPAWAS